MLKRDYRSASKKTIKDDDSFSECEEDFYQAEHLNTDNNQPSAPILLKKNSKQIDENYEDRIYVEHTSRSLNYIGKPIINTELYEFTCHETKDKFLAKIDSLHNIQREFNFLKKFKHKNILEGKKYFTNDDSTYLLYPNCGYLTLEEHLNQKRKKKLPEYEVRFIITELVNLLKYLKSKNVIHRNLRLSNILVTKKGGIKVMGFESAVELTSGKNNYDKNYCLTDNIDFVITPEMIDDINEYDKKLRFSYETDLWAIGSIMYNLLVGEFPVITNKTNMHRFIKSIPNVSNEASDCLKRLLEPNSKERQKLNQIFLLPFFEESE